MTIGAELENELSDLQNSLEANVSRFGAYKGFLVERQIEKIMRQDIPAELKANRVKEILHVAKLRQDAEYNTTVAQARTAKQFAEFNTPERLEVFPNIRWLPSASVHPREEHKVFYNRVWSKDDPFWSRHHPGDLWNCKCDMEETDDAVTDGSGRQEPEGAPKAAKGLEGNPWKTGKVFSDDASYFRLPESLQKPARSFYVANERTRLTEELKQTGTGLEDIKNLSTGKFKDSRKAYNNFVFHAYNEEEFAVASVIRQRIGRLANPSYSPLGAGKNALDPKAAKNIAKKKSRGVTGYNKYLFNFMGKEWRIVMEVNKKGYEQLYAITPK